MSLLLRRVSHVSPATLLALVALCLSSGGLAIAATSGSGSIINACYSKSSGAIRLNAGGKKCRGGEKQISWNKQGPQGFQGIQGVQGKQGLQGAQGLAGAAGLPAASMLTGSANTAVTSSALAAYAEPVGLTTSVASPDTTHLELSPNATVIARDLAVKITGPAPNGGTVFTFAIHVNGTDSAVRCSIPAGQTTCDSGNATATIPPGSTLALTTSATGTVDGQSRPFIFGWRATTP